VVTRPLPGAHELASHLEALGLDVALMPAIEIVPPTSEQPLKEAAAAVQDGRYDWVAFTSVNAVNALAGAMPWVSASLGEGLAARVAAIGPATAAAAAGLGWRVDLQASTYTAEGLLEAFDREGITPGTVLIPGAEEMRDVLPVGLRERGYDVHAVVAYRTVRAEGGDVDAFRARLRSGELQVVTFASPSAAEHFLESVGELARELPAVVIGPATAKSTKRLGYRVVGVADPHTSEGLARAAAEWVFGG
jgi:uroporphyrinogen-III synthase